MTEGTAGGVGMVLVLAEVGKRKASVGGTETVLVLVEEGRREWLGG
jgi:hypothetical protein